MSEFHDFLLERLTSNGGLESFTSHLNFLEFSVSEELMISLIVFLSPVGGSEVLVVVRDIIELIRKFMESTVFEVHTMWSFNDVIFDDFADIMPFFHEFLSCW